MELFWLRQGENMAKSDIAVIQLLWDIINQKTGEIGNVDFLPQKPAFDQVSQIEQALPRSTPEEQGVSSLFISDMVNELAASRNIHMHQIMVLRHGRVIYECGFDPYPAGIWHVTYSMCKSFTGMAIGLLIDDGKLSLDDKLTDILAEDWAATRVNILTVLRFRSITVRDLLTMSTGVAFNETGAISGNNWVRNYFESTDKFEPGTKFEYNSMNSLMLSAIVTKITGLTMFDFLKERIFTPMGITKVFWEISPRGLTKGGWGMFITEEDAAKLGLLYMNYGKWNGRQLISGDFVRASTTRQIDTGSEENPEYGYHVWMDCRPDSFCYNGMLGQNVHCYRDIDMIIVTNAGNEEVFQSGNMTTILRKYIREPYQPSDMPLPKDSLAAARLRDCKGMCERSLVLQTPIIRGGWGRGHGGSVRPISSEQSYKEFINKIDRTSWKMEQTGIGLFPLIMQVVHNNYTNGISALSFRKDNGILHIDLTEGQQIHSLPVGFNKGRHTELNMNGEEYLAGVTGRFSSNEDDIPVLSLRIAFVEEATERQLRIYFTDDDTIELHWNESPGDVIITDTIELITVGSGNTNPLITQLIGKMNPDVMSRVMQNTIEPVVKAKLMV